MRVQVVGTSWRSGVPVLRVVDLDHAPPRPVTHLYLKGDFCWDVAPGPSCVGRHGPEGQEPCPDNAPVDTFSQCPRCTELEEPACVFEPMCKDDPSTCICTFGPVPHVVYCAWYGTLPKIGMTQEARVTTRLREQGADAWTLVHRCPDRATARATERTVSFLYRIPEWRTHRETLPQLARPVPWPQIETRATELARRFASRFDSDPTVHRIEHPAMPQPLPAVPHKVESEGSHAGTWVGLKGNYLVYAMAPRQGRLDVGAAPLAALKRSDLVGRTITLP